MPADYDIIIFWVLEIAFLLFVVIGFIKKIRSKKDFDNNDDFGSATKRMRQLETVKRMNQSLEEQEKISQIPQKVSEGVKPNELIKNESLSPEEIEVKCCLGFLNIDMDFTRNPPNVIKEFCRHLIFGNSNKEYYYIDATGHFFEIFTKNDCTTHYRRITKQKMLDIAKEIMEKTLDSSKSNIKHEDLLNNELQIVYELPEDIVVFDEGLNSINVNELLKSECINDELISRSQIENLVVKELKRSGLDYFDNKILRKYTRFLFENYGMFYYIPITGSFYKVWEDGNYYHNYDTYCEKISKDDVIYRIDLLIEWAKHKINNPIILSYWINVLKMARNNIRLLKENTENYNPNDITINLYGWCGLGDYDYLCEFPTNIKQEYFKDVSIPEFDEKYYIFLSIKRMTYAVPFSISLIFGPQYNSDSPIGEKLDCEYDLRNFVFEEYRMY